MWVRVCGQASSKSDLCAGVKGFLEEVTQVAAPGGGDSLKHSALVTWVATVHWPSAS